ncbi:MAG: hypothetical protein ACRDZR_03645 [Acidimicrobiales bacterium]
MNFLAHALVAARTGSGSTERVVGAVLPDLAGMAHIRPVGDRLGGELSEGVRCHHEADRAFHADRTFTTGARRLRLAALDAGLPPGASRAVGHLGWELLLDGELLHRSDAAAVFGTALASAPSATAAFAPGDRGRWLQLVEHLDRSRWWCRYHDPEVVAEALRRRTASRPRLAFGPTEVPAVARMLAEAQGSVAAASGLVVDRVVAGLRDRAGQGTPVGVAPTG